MVALDDDVDDSRTGGRPRRDGFSAETTLPLIGGRLRVGLAGRGCGGLLVDAKTPGE